MPLPSGFLDPHRERVGIDRAGRPVRTDHHQAVDVTRLAVGSAARGAIEVALHQQIARADLVGIGLDAGGVLVRAAARRGGRRGGAAYALAFERLLAHCSHHVARHAGVELLAIAPDLETEAARARSAVDPAPGAGELTGGRFADGAARDQRHLSAGWHLSRPGRRRQRADKVIALRRERKLAVRRAPFAHPHRAIERDHLDRRGGPGFPSADRGAVEMPRLEALAVARHPHDEGDRAGSIGDRRDEPAPGRPADG